MSKANFDHLVFAQNYAIKICVADLFRENDRIRKEEIEKISGCMRNYSQRCSLNE